MKETKVAAMEHTTRNTSRRIAHMLAILAAALVFALSMSSDAWADDIASGESGTCTWTIDSFGKLTVRPASGDTGELGTWGGLVAPPWGGYRNQITSASFENVRV